MRLQLEGTSLSDLQAQVLAEHGTTATIIKVEKVTVGGIRGFFARKHYELIVEITQRPDGTGRRRPADSRREALRRRGRRRAAGPPGSGGHRRAVGTGGRGRRRLQRHPRFGVDGRWGSGRLSDRCFCGRCVDPVRHVCRYPRRPRQHDGGAGAEGGHSGVAAAAAGSGGSGGGRRHGRGPVHRRGHAGDHCGGAHGERGRRLEHRRRASSRRPASRSHGEGAGCPIRTQRVRRTGPGRWSARRFGAACPRRRDREDAPGSGLGGGGRRASPGGHRGSGCG